MYAVVNIAGHQVKVDKGERLRVPRLAVEEGTTCLLYTSPRPRD